MTETTQAKFVAVNAAKKTQIEHDGEVVEVEYLPITRLFRDEALEKSVVVFKQAYNEEGFSPSTYRNELAHRIVKKWSIPAPLPEGWDMLTDDDLVDKICEATGIEDAVQSLQRRASKEAEKAKNL